MIEELGFSIACYHGDLPLLRGCLASIKYFAPDAPICLITDGNFSTRSLERDYSAVTLRRADVRNKDLQKWSYGYGLTKMVGLWESPFERFVHIDADAVLWGDIRKNIPPGNFDFVFNEPHEIITEKIQCAQYFDPTLVFPIFPYFPWRDCPFFNSGVFVTRRDLFDMDEYMRLLEFQRVTPGSLLAGEQGILNFMVFNALHTGRLTAASTHLQSAVPVLAKPELESRFRFENGHPVPWFQPTVIHWAGPKPWADNLEIFRDPMDHFRDIATKGSLLHALLPGTRYAEFDEWMCRDVLKSLANLKKQVKNFIRN
ncbi:hypothetical protein EI77_02517 [Prosthecobacter fusiformis]|uniref:Glycosyl transferase family 8 n=1 Tax=Prosthecobacter fusiformis TaxID=48464 RepID=A0A4V3FFM8_9BACT|nr:hypothetical protein [Prosthecobacter fusiformis]TDU71393.1 hypothetical protein EI77_02517 [Prosthecobacter fusiformis]